MSWQLLVGLSVILYSINSLLHRTIMKDEGSDPYAQAVVFTGLVGIFSFIVLLILGGLQARPTRSQLPLFFIVSSLTALGMVFNFKGFKSVGASEHAILSTSSRLWSIAGAIFFLQEDFTATRLLGTMIILFGVVLAQWEKQKLVINKGTIYVLLAAMFFAAGETLSFFIVRNFDILSFIVYASFLVTATLIIFKPKVIKKLPFYLVPKNGLNIIITSISDGSANIFGFTAYQVGRNALQIGPLMSTQTLLTVVLAFFILKERGRLVQKIIASIAAVIGVALLL